MSRRHVRLPRGLGASFWLAATWLTAVLFAALTASWLPLDPTGFDPRNGLASPSWSHPFGTTRLGEDVFAICVHGCRLAVIIGAGAALVGFVLGVPLGVAAGYFRGMTDRAVTTLLDALMAFPALVLALALALFLGQSLMLIVIIVAVLLAPVFARAARAATLTVVDRDFVSAARLTGARHGRILVREIGPNVAAPLATYALILSGVAILLEGGLSFVGLGAPLDKASWGRLIVGGRDELQGAWWWSMCPSAVFFLTVLSLNLIGDALQARWLGLPRRQRREVAPGTWGRPSPSADRSGMATHPLSGQGTAAVLGVDTLRTALPTPFGLVNAVNAVSLSIARGEMLAVVGESGAGKTMLARSILGIAPAGALIDGRILLDGSDLRALSAAELRRRRGRDIAVVLQDPMTALNPVMRVGNQIAELTRVHLGLRRREARRRAVELLGEMGIAEPAKRARQYPHELSGGQRQRAAIALALSCGPKLLIADEPTSALDVMVQAQVLDLIDRLRADRQLAVLLITHDLPMAMARADRIAVMYAGRVVEETSRGEARHGLRMPYAAALFAAAPKLSTPAHTAIASIPGRPPIMIGDLPGCAFASRCGQAGERCATDEPQLTAVGGDGSHRLACWHPLERGHTTAVASSTGFHPR